MPDLPNLVKNRYNSKDAKTFYKPLFICKPQVQKHGIALCLAHKLFRSTYFKVIFGKKMAFYLQQFLKHLLE